MDTEDLQLESRVEAGPDVYEFRTADGLASPGEFRPAELALLGAVVPESDDDVLVVGANYGVVGCVLADLTPGGYTALTETSARAARVCAGNVERNGCEAHVLLTAALDGLEGAAYPPVTGEDDLRGQFDVAAYAPRGYDPVPVVVERCRRALGRLRAGGSLFVAAHKDEGARRYRDALGVMAEGVERVAKEGDVRVLQARATEGLPPGDGVVERTVEATVRGISRSLCSRPGLFSSGHLDGGTRHLLAELPVRDGDRVLDLACGYGPVGTYAAGLADCDVWFTDDDVVAARYAGGNARANGVEARDVVAGDAHRGVLEAEFDLVAANPPTHAGDGVIADLFRGTRQVLAADGRFALVYNDVLGYEERLREWFHEVEVRREADGFHVTVCRRPQ